MRVIWVTTNLPHPADTGGSAHEFDILRSLSVRHDIHLITSNITSDPSRSELEPLGVRLERIDHRVRPHPDNRIGVAVSMLRAQPTLLLWLLRDRIEKMAEAVRRAEQETPADLVHVTHGELAPVLAATRAPRALLLFDSYVRHKDRQLEHETVLRRRCQLHVERWRAARWERRWYTPLEGVAAVSPLDAATTERIIGRSVEVLPNPIPEDFFDPPLVPRDPLTVTFVGSLLYPPNIDAIRWLVEEIWPQVIARVPNASLRVVGRSDGGLDAVSRMREAVEDVGGKVVVDVPDIRPSYWEAGVVVAPVRLGAGLRNKVIHAMACGAPVVATPASLEGVPAIPGEDVLVGETATQLADRIVELLANRDLAERVVRAGLGVAEQFRSSVVNARFEAWWERTAARAAT